MSGHEPERQDAGPPADYVPATGRLPEALDEDAAAAAELEAAADAERIDAELRAAGNID